jgi:hypothetical protein
MEGTPFFKNMHESPGVPAGALLKYSVPHQIESFPIAPSATLTKRNINAAPQVAIRPPNRLKLRRLPNTVPIALYSLFE